MQSSEDGERYGIQKLMIEYKQNKGDDNNGDSVQVSRSGVWPCSGCKKGVGGNRPYGSQFASLLLEASHMTHSRKSVLIMI